MPASVSKRPARSAAWALTSCTPIQSAPSSLRPRPAAPCSPPSGCRSGSMKRNATRMGSPTASTPTDALAQDFVKFSVEAGVLRFGEFKTKAGGCRPISSTPACSTTAPSSGASRNSMHAACSTAACISTCCSAPPTRASRWPRRWRSSWRGSGRNVPFAYNRKEAKDHGEGGVLVGAPVAGRVLIIDDVISAGTSVRESIEIIRAAGAAPCGVAIALDRQEKATEAGADADNRRCSTSNSSLHCGWLRLRRWRTCWSICSRRTTRACVQHFARVEAYRERYGV